MAALAVSIKLGPGAYNEQYEKDQIYDQNPKPGTKIAKGGIVTIYLSLGPEPEVKTMENLTGLEEDAAKNFLMDVLGIERSNIFIRTETSSTVAEGLVTRTDPVEDEELKEGQVVQIWISSGPEKKYGKVPNVYGQTKEKAEALMNANGFKNIIFEEVVSNKQEGIVVGQSEAAQSEIDVTTKITLQVSMGTGVPVTDPTEPPIPTIDPELKTKIVKIGLPEDILEDYVLSVWLDGEMLQERDIPVGTISTEFELSGKGEVTFEFRINNANPWTIKVDFDE